MRFQTGEFDQLLCPLPKCGADLHLVREFFIPLGCTSDYAQAPGPEDAVTESWKVSCTEGHTIATYRGAEEDPRSFTVDAFLAGEVELDCDHKWGEDANGPVCGLCGERG